FKAAIVTSLPGNGSLLYDGSPLSLPQSVSAADLAAGKLVFSPAANANGNPYASFKFKVQDDGGIAYGGADTSANEATMTVNVRSVNDAPTAVDSSVTTNEDTDKVFAAADFSFSDANDTPANAFKAALVTSLPGNGSLLYDGSPLSVPQSVSAADLAAGKLVFSPAANANGNPYASFKFKVQDDGGIAYGGAASSANEATMTVNVRSVNDAPSGADKTVVTKEDTPYTLLTSDFGFSDANDNPANNL